MRTSNIRARSSLSVHQLAAAAAGAAMAILAAASPARAQYQVGSGGHLNDVNNRIGGGGYNSPSSSQYQSSINSQIVTGNVSGLGYFHGNSNGEFDSNVFQGSVNSGTVNAFNQISAPVNYAARTTGASVYTPYYNTQSFVGTAPANFVPTANGVGYVPAPTKSALTPDTGNVRLQNFNDPLLDQNGTNLPAPGALNQPGPVNNVGDPAIYSQSSLYGVRQMDTGDQAGQGSLFEQRYGSIRPGGMARLDATTIKKMQNELQVAANGGQNDNAAADLGTNANLGASRDMAATPGAPGQKLPGQAGPDQATDANGGAGSGVTGSSVTGTTLSGKQVPSSVNTPYGAQQNNVFVPANLQSKQILELQRRFAAANPRPDAMQQANQNNRLLKAMRDAKEARLKSAIAGNGADVGTDADKTGTKAATVTGAPVAGVAPVGSGAGIATTARPQSGVKPGDMPSVVRDDAALTNPDQPFVITSLAVGIKAPGLAKLLRDAEGQMRSGQFGQSVDTYDTAAEVAPTNPFVPLGRGFAELGASYYGKAETDLTRAILTEPALLAAQYDLKGFLGADRLKFVQKDLADIGATEQTARPYLLLAYIDHNTGANDATVTAKDLDTAESRGANPKLIGYMREAWGLKVAAK